MILNVRREVDGFKIISSGPQSGPLGDPKIIFRNALMLGAVKIILAHNHPSGSLKPSTADIGFTEKVIEAGKAIDIPLVDHIIFTPKGYTSMRADRYCAFEAFA
jgi:DNA repair protein RadC